MNLTCQQSHASQMNGLADSIFDEDRMEDGAVGEVTYETGVSRRIELYGRYKGTVKTHEECIAFIKGVQAVLEYMIG
jgi:hypothetical protein